MILRSILTAFSTYSVIPVPGSRWDENSARFSMCAFPLIGAVIGVLLFLWSLISESLSMPGPIRTAGLFLIPLWISGGIHMDGFIDTCDALASHKSRDIKLSILKDPHVGAFALIDLGALFVIEYSLWSTLSPEFYDPLCVLLIHTFSRCLSGLSVLSFPIAQGSSMALMFAGAAREKGRAAMIIQLSECVLAAVLFCLRGPAGVLCMITGVIIFLFYRRLSEKQFGGLNGDQAGWFLTVAEAGMLAALVTGRVILRV